MRAKRYWIILSGLLGWTSVVSHGASQDEFEAYRRQQLQGIEQTRDEFHAYKKKQDAEFADFLKAQWRDFDTYRGKVRIKDPKPRQTPVVTVPKPSPAPAERPKLPQRESKPEVAVAPPVSPPPAPVLQVPPRIEVEPPVPVRRPEEIAPRIPGSTPVMFYGNALAFVFEKSWKDYRYSGSNKPETLSAFWSQMSATQYDPLVQSVGQARRQLKLDDWGYVALWRNVAEEIQPRRRTEQNLLLWFFLIKAGYDVRLGYSGENVHLFIAVKQQVFATKYISDGRQTYYALLEEDHGDGIKKFFTYEASYPEKLNPIDIGRASTGFTRAIPARRALSFDFKGQQIKLEVPYDRRLVEYLDSFPQSEFAIYFDTDGSSLLREGLLTELRKHTANMERREALDFLLAFVQKAFAYKRDDEQFGREKYFFVEESLHFPFNDCEDRSVMFAWLVHELLGMKVVGLLYPGHVTTAVLLEGDSVRDGATVEYRGQNFIIADPTYIGASAGMAMASYAKLKPTQIFDIQY